ncbi:ATP-dependent Clp protease ATP-binding subunit [Alkaliphilus hydrothermalis]|uniref:ATP-dependent Clp protease ATP-binding subunit ClpA n=1 Tax=Alkaliphilus hydrothermalis TaxID=1482730 RepID=A0ABS2NRC1_9FIRM|nr:ATP-dependent Clp protease ATP-binding subunit [Alkaliphilus hydrothermalis]MBM7615514.1 ATP-dependent Clp protease ATP-binding subunit ClpA [Alkaliphilus hydrothermalis]
MKKCSVCNKNIAVVFASKLENGKTEMTGLCIECAKKMGIPIIDQIMQQTGLSAEEVENLTEQMNETLDDLGDMDINDTDNLMKLFKDSFSSMKGLGGFGKELDSVDHDEDDDFKDDHFDNEEQDSHDRNQDIKKKKKSKKKKFLDTYGTNLTDKALNKEVDRIIGRNREIDRVVQILNRRSKNNPILIGEPGVGKTAIAEGLAVRIVEKQVPSKLFNTEVYLLDLTAIVAGTQFRGQFEGRMKSIIKEAQDLGNVILVIDEVHNIMGAGEVHGGVMNAANILKPALARGEIQIIGATTLEEYRKHIEKDSALERRFQPVIVDEPTVEESIEILRGIKGYYEDYHKVKISEEVIESAVRMSERYITDRYLPDKAIDVLDEAGSRANLKNQGLVELESLKEELTALEEKIQLAATHDDYEKAAEYKVEECKLKEKIKEIEKQSFDVKIGVEDIAFVIEAWTKIPVQKITEEDAEKLLNLENQLHRRIIGQDEAIKSIARTIRRNRSGFRKKKKPASFIFVGPTGVGKTELVKALAYELFGSEEALIRVDMSEYMEKHTVSKLIGAPPGYVGYDQGGQLTDKVRRKPYSVILMDEIEKAHPDVFNMLLQILDDGRLTDNQGRTTHFENTVVIMTSNAGSHLKTKTMGFKKDQYEAMESRVKDALKEIFRPEFLNRVDETIVFTQLNKDELKQIVDLMLKEVIEDVSERKITLGISDEVKSFILEKGYDEKYGARPIKRTIQRYIEDELAEYSLKHPIEAGDHLEVTLEDDKIFINKKSQE